MFRLSRWLFVFLLAWSLEGNPREVLHQAHGWYNYFGDHPIGDSRWGVHLEGQWRRHNVILQGQQLLLRPAVNYEVNDLLMLSAGYAFAHTHRYGAAPVAAVNGEHRLWQQALLRYRQSKASWTTRIRFEERFLERIGREEGTAKYRHENRIRILQQIRVPIRGAAYGTAYNEFWSYVKPYVSNSAFDQNRAYGAFGWQFNQHWRMEAGYLNQTILQRSGSVLESNHTLVFSVISNEPFGK